MIKTIAKAVTIERFDKAIEINDDRLIVEAWEMQYMNRFLARIDLAGYTPDPDDSDPPLWPFPWPFPRRRLESYGRVLDLIDSFDPTPETSRILDKELRFKAAQNVLSQLKDATAKLEKELSL